MWRRPELIFCSRAAAGYIFRDIVLTAVEGENTRSKPVTWIGDGWRSSTNGKRHFTYYKRFKFGSIVAGVGDFIMVANADAAEPDTMEGSDVAKIKKIWTGPLGTPFLPVVSSVTKRGKGSEIWKTLGLFKGAFFYCEGPNIKHVRNRTECEADKRNSWNNRKYNFDDLGKALMSLFVLSSRDGWVNIMYTGLDAVGVDQQELYETNSNPKDPFRAVVQWYSRAADIPTKWSLSKSITVQPVLNYPNEVVEDRRPFDTNISIETVFSSCKVMTIDWNEDPSLWSDHDTSAGGVFVCRYRLVPVLNRVRCCLEPAIDHWPNEPPLVIL
uniref:Ion transport domain-containing protein n=1 Tax=Timema monikensis TaxID=170555 RepID=A0A7R9DYL3_9NEOP|nr:unnamed protein product [Timema monikensis]